MTKSKLKAVKPAEAKPSRPKILVFGKAGVGKTWTSLDFPNTYLIDSEGGANLRHYTDKLTKSGGVYFGIEQGSQDYKTVIEEVKILATEKHEYKTLVIDSLSHLFNIEVTKEAERLGEKNGFGADKKPAIAMTRKLVMWLEKLDMNVILICHEKAQWANDKQIGTTFDAYDKLDYILHLSLNIVKQGESRKAVVKKTRLEGFPDSETFPWSYEEFANKFGREIMEETAHQLVLATAEQIAKVKALLDLWKAPDGQLDKWFNAANCESWEDMDTDKIGKIIDYINDKIKGL